MEWAKEHAKPKEKNRNAKAGTKKVREVIDEGVINGTVW